MEKVHKIASAQKNKYLLAIIALLVIPISGFSIDIYVPSLPAVSHYFNVNKSLAQLTITTFMIGFGFMQLFSGSQSDSIGRKKPFLIAMTAYILTALLIPYSQNIYQLLFLRFMQGAAVAYLSVPMRAVISDLFEGQEFYKIMNYMTIVWALGPIIAPFIGGYLQHYFGWRAPFYFLATYGIVMLLLNLAVVPETIQHYQTFQITQLLSRYRQILFHLDYFIGLICLGILYSLLILFGIVGSFLIQNVLHYSSVDFGHMALLMGFSWFLGNMTNRFFIHVSVDRKVKICLWLMSITAILMLIIAVSKSLDVYNILIPTFILLYLGGIVFPNYFAKGIALFPKMPATANSLMGAFMILIAGGCSALGTLLKSDSQIPLTITYTVLTIICLFTYYLCNFLKREKAKEFN